MNGPHDMGGMHGFGPIDPEPESQEPVFHADWERRAFALTLASAAIGGWTLDASRFARERIDPADYLAMSYYEKWLEGMRTLLVEHGVVSAAELAAGRPTEKANPDRILRGDAVDAAMARGGPTEMAIDAAPVFKVGDRVRARVMNPEGHTRNPRYVRGHVGTVVLHHGGHVYADANAVGERRAEHLYTVSFAARDLWGERAGAADTVRVDLWQPYLEPA
ncbi:MAG: nitrile hydratase subunit beta [Alphaproteobacteria bacterium]